MRQQKPDRVCLCVFVCVCVCVEQIDQDAVIVVVYLQVQSHLLVYSEATLFPEDVERAVWCVSVCLAQTEKGERGCVILV